MATARGPLPAKNRRRRNAPTVPTTSLPAGGRKGRPPAVPGGYDLKKAGRDWWKWAWTTPQAAAWDTGSRYALARRAQLEDDLAAIEVADDLDIAKLLGVDANEMARDLEAIFRRLKGLAGGRLSVMKEMRELDTKFGLTPESLARLRWEIVAPEDDPGTRKRARKSSGAAKRMRAHDPAGAG